MSGNSITRIVTLYAHWDYVRRWVFDDTLLQPHVTWIFINDKPGDPAPPAIRERLERIGTLIENRVNMGRCCARNLGVFQARSEWIDIVDGDDLPLPIAPDFLAGRETSDLIYFPVTHHREIGGAVVNEADPGWVPDELCRMYRAIIGNWDCRPAAVLWRRTAFCALGGFDGRFDYSEDFNLTLRARVAQLPYSFMDTPKVNYQRDTAARPISPIAAVAGLKNWELARTIAPPGWEPQIDTQIRFYQKALLWAGMSEMRKSAPSVALKVRESIKWFLGRY